MDQQTLEQLKRFLNGMNQESLSKEEFSKAFEKVVQFVLQIQKRQQEAIDDLERTYGEVLAKMRGDHQSAFEGLRGQVDNLFVQKQLDRMDSEHKDAMKRIEDKLATVRNGRDGQTIVGPRGAQGPAGSADKPEQIASKLNSLKDILDLDVIKGLKEALKLMNQKVTFVGSGKGAAAPRGRITYYDLSSRLDGTTKVFTLPAYWAIFGVFVSSGPVILRPTIDYTLTATDITFTSQIDAPTILAAGQSVIIQYEEA